MPEDSALVFSDALVHETPRRGALARNATLNGVRVLVFSAVALLLPPLLVRTLPLDAYNTWLLVMQITAYVGYLEFGIQNAIGRFIAESLEHDDPAEQRRIIATGLLLMTVLALAGAVAVVTVGWLLPNLFSHMPKALISHARVALSIVGLSTALALPSLVFAGGFIGLQRYDVPIGIMILAKIAGSSLVALAAFRTGNIQTMAAVIGLINVASAAAMWLAWRRQPWTPSGRPQWATKSHARLIAGHCASATVWTAAGLLINGLDLAIVGVWDFESVAYFSISALAASFIVQVQDSLVSVFLPAAASLRARGATSELSSMLLRSTRYGTLILLALSLPIFMFANALLRMWVGATFATEATPILRVLIVGNFLRHLALPYAALLVGVGEHGKAWRSPVLGGIVNCSLSVAATIRWGAIGAALGTVVGGVVELALHFGYNMSRTQSMHANPRHVLRSSVLRPLLTTLPLLPALVLVSVGWLSLNAWGARVVVGGSGLASLCLAWKFGLEPGERLRIRDFAMNRLRSLRSRSRGTH